MVTVDPQRPVAEALAVRGDRIVAVGSDKDVTPMIGDGKDRVPMFYGYLLGAAVMIVGGLIAVVLGVSAEGKSLEDVAAPLAARRSGTTRVEGSARATFS